MTNTLVAQTTLQEKKVYVSGKHYYPSAEVLSDFVQYFGGEVVQALTAEVDYVLLGTTGNKTAEKKCDDLNKKSGAQIHLCSTFSDFARLAMPTSEDCAALLRIPEKTVTWNTLDRLAGQVMEKIVVQDVDLSRLRLNGAMFSNTSFQRVNMVEVDATACCFNAIVDCTLDGATLTQSVFAGQITGCSFRKADMANGIFHTVSMENCCFDGAKLQGIQATYFSAVGNVSFANCDMTSAVFNNSVLAGANFAGANLEKANLSHVSFIGANFAKACLSNAELAGANLTKADLSGANFRSASLIGADLSDATVAGADFTGANLSGATVANVDLTSAKGLAEAFKNSLQVVAGPKLLELEKVIGTGNGVTFESQLNIEFQSRMQIDIVYNGYYYRTQRVALHIRDLDRNSNVRWELASISDAFARAAAALGRSPAKILSVTAKTAGKTMTSKEFTALTLESWCETLAIPVPADKELKATADAIKSKKQDQRSNLLEGLRQGHGGVAAWNEAGDKLMELGSFKKTDLSGKDLHGLNAKWKSLDFQGSTFDNADLHGSELESTDFRKSSFKNTNLAGASLGSCHFNDCDFSNADVSGVSFRGAALQGANFQNAALNNSDFGLADLSKADFTGADLSECLFTDTKFNHETKLPAGFELPSAMLWKGLGLDPRLAEEAAALLAGGSISIEDFLKSLGQNFEDAKIKKALQMLKAERFKLFNEVSDTYVVGVVKSQNDPDLVYSCRLASDGSYACCTQNLNSCGGLRGALCKHLLVLLIGLVNSEELDPTHVVSWIIASKAQKPVLNKDIMGATFIRYKGAEAGEVDWRPTETIPEDYYAF